MSEKELENLLKREGYLSNFRIKALCTEEQIEQVADTLEKWIDKKYIQGFLKDGVVYYKETVRTLC